MKASQVGYHRWFVSAVNVAKATNKPMMKEEISRQKDDPAVTVLAQGWEDLDLISTSITNSPCNLDQVI